MVSFFDRLFGRKGAKREPDRVFMSKDAKWRSLKNLEGTTFIAHFPATKREVQEFARARSLSISIRMASDLAPGMGVGVDPNLKVAVLERHPLRAHDDRVGDWADSAASSLVFLVSLEDSLLNVFAGSLHSVLDRLGIDPNEAIEHAMVSQSIASAQDKIRKTATGDLPAESDAQWVKVNLPPAAD
jgi:hypothetical protein